MCMCGRRSDANWLQGGIDFVTMTSVANMRGESTRLLFAALCCSAAAAAVDAWRPCFLSCCCFPSVCVAALEAVLEAGMTTPSSWHCLRIAANESPMGDVPAGAVYQPRTFKLQLIFIVRCCHT